MDTLNFPFGTPYPVSFTEPDCDIVFEARVSGRANVTEYDPSAFDEEPQTALKKKITGLIFDCLNEWVEGKRKICKDNCVILSGLLEKKLAADGITANIEVINIKLVDCLAKTYSEKFSEDLIPQVKLEKDENGFTKHGRLKSISYNRFSHGMMCGTSSSSQDKVEWDENGSAILKYSSSGGQMNVSITYKLDDNAARQLYNYVVDNHLAALAEKESPPCMGADNITTSTINMVFDDSEYGKSPSNYVTINCGMAGTYYRKIEDALYELFTVCKETGQCIDEQRSKNETSFSNLFGSMGMQNKTQLAEIKAKKETHGTLIGCSYYDCGGGTAVCDTSSEETVCALNNGVQLINTHRKISFGPEYTAVYKPRQDVLAAVRELVERENLAAWSELKLPMASGLFYAQKSPNITLIFDDSSIGGESCVKKVINLSFANFFGGADVVKEFHELLGKGIDNAEEISKIVKGETSEIPVKREEWTCALCGSRNTSRFCTECGAPGIPENVKET